MKEDKSKKSKTKKASQSTKVNDSNSFGESSNSYNSTVSRTTSTPRTPLPPNQSKKVNNKRAARRKREQLLEASRQAGGTTPLSDSSTTRLKLNEMKLKNGDEFDDNEDVEMIDSDDGKSFDSSDSENLLKGAKGDYKDLPCDALILNTETVKRIMEQIETDIEDEIEDEDENNSNNSNDSDSEDEIAKNEGVQRYFLENSGPKCFNCGECGHVVKDCPITSTVPCNLCGQLGHMRMNCPQELCYNCSRPGHQSKACPARRKRRVYDDEFCNRCTQPGHLARECSLAWRGYVFSRDLPRSHSTFLDELRRLRKRCYNCASISHFGDDCPSKRRPNYSVFHIPDYDYLDRVILKIRRENHNNNRNGNYSRDNNDRDDNNSRDDNDSRNSNNNTRDSRDSSTKIPITTNVTINAKNAKQKQADNFNKIVNNHQKQQNIQKSPQKKKKDSHVSHSVSDNLSDSKSQNRKVFMQSRGIVEESAEEAAVPFVRYEQNRIVVNLVDDEGEGEGNFKKGSSSIKSGPKYRGGYK